jgi:hypothetical protein
MAWNKVAVVGAGLIKMGELFEQSYEQMAAGAFEAAVAAVDKGSTAASRSRVPSHQRGTLWGQEGIGGNTVPSAIGLGGVPCTRIENACPSGSDAFRVGAMAVASDVHDVVLVIGVEKMRDKSTEEGLLSRAAAGHPISRGRDRPVLFAPFATRHMHEFGTTPRCSRRCGEEPPQRPSTRTLTSGTRSRSSVLAVARCATAAPPRLLSADRRRPPRCCSPAAAESSRTSPCTWRASASPPTTPTSTRRRASRG